MNHKAWNAEVELNEYGYYQLVMDVGCGEGFTLNYFHQKNWQVTGLDMSDYGCETHNPECLPNLIQADLYEGLGLLEKENRKFDVVWLDNVLEHVLDPLDLVRRCQSLLFDDGAVVIEVSQAGLTPFRIIADFPIDFALFNENTNYIKSPEVGGSVHRARIAVEELMHSQSVDQTNDLYEAMATMGLGRQIVAFFEND